MAPTAGSSGTTLLRGGEWLLQPSDPAAVFTPERTTDEHRLIAQTVTDFVDNEVLPVLDRLEQKDWDLARRLVRALRASSACSASTCPRRTAACELDKVTSMIVSERMSRVGVVRRDVRRAGEPDDPAAVALRHRGAEAQVPAEAPDRRD